MRRVRQRLMRVRIAWARVVARVPRPYRRAMRTVVVLWLVIAAVAAVALAPRRLAGTDGVRWTAARWIGQVVAVARRLPMVDELASDEERLAGAALRMAMPALFRHADSDGSADAAWPGVVRRIVQAATGVDPGDPVSLLAAGLPGFSQHVQALADDALPASARTLARGDDHAGTSVAATQPPSSGDAGAVAIRSDVSRPGQTAPQPGAPSQPAAPAPLPDPPANTGGPLPGSVTPEPAEQPAVFPELPERPDTPSLMEPLAPMSPLERLRSVAWGQQCLVLIYHTHTSEMYRTDTFAPASPDQYHRFNTTDTGIVHVGRALAQRLQELGVPACHVTTVHDWPSHPRAYIEARTTLERFLAANPQVEIVLDVHRDAPEGLIATVGGRRAAQIAFVLGTHPGMQPNWRDNAAFARSLADMLEARYPGLFRRIIERPDARLNQDLHPRAVLVEIGSYDTHVDEAVISAEILAEVIADMLYVMRFGRSAFD